MFYKINANNAVERQLDNQPHLNIKTPKTFSDWNENKQSLKQLKLKRWKHLEEYCENSTIHGLTYFPDRNIHLVERIWWIISVSCSMVACCILISKSYAKWNENPIIVTFSEKMTPLSDIPFPAVTICPEIKTNRKLFDYAATLDKLNSDLTDQPLNHGLSPRELTLAAAQFQICSKGYDLIKIGDNLTTDDIFDSIKEVAPNINETLFICKFRSFSDDCNYLFQELITDDGLCFTFNSLTYEAMFLDGFNKKLLATDRNQTDILNHWSLEDGYYENFDDTKNEYLYPYRVLSAGSDAGLRIDLIMQEENVDFMCRGPLQGFKVILHTPNELPQLDKIFVCPSNMLTTTKSLKDYTPDRRQCYFNADRQLRYMKTYTQRNCELECLSNYILSKCGCVKFSMPHDNSTAICGVAKVMCHVSNFNVRLTTPFATL